MWHEIMVYIVYLNSSKTVNAGDKHIIGCKFLIVFFLSISLINTFVLEPTTDV